jgi:hypothetical protein
MGYFICWLIATAITLFIKGTALFFVWNWVAPPDANLGYWQCFAIAGVLCILFGRYKAAEVEERHGGNSVRVTVS